VDDSYTNMSAGDRPSEAVDPGRGGLEEASNVLVLSPSMSDRARGSYFESIFPARSVGLDVLAIDYRRTPDQWLDEWKRHVGGRPRSCLVVSVDETTRSAASTVAAGTRRQAAVGVDNPGDLTGLGITVSEYLSEHAGPGTLVTFDSLTVLLQYVDLQRAFRFLHVLSNRVRSADAIAHYHMDPGAHGDREIATLASLFDAVAEFDDGEWTVRDR
jgi:hypothetical protein